jgi:hypothetical protein
MKKFSLCLLALTTLFSSAAGFHASNAEAATFDWSFSGVWTVGTMNTLPITGSGTITADDLGGDNYKVQTITGTIFDFGPPPLFTTHITGVNPVYAGADNLFHVSSSPQLTFNGISFNLDNGAAMNFYYLNTSSGHAGDPYDCGAAGYCIITSFNQADENPPMDTRPSYAELTEFSITPAAVGAVPEASTWAMMLLGFAGLGAMASRHKSKSTSLAK